MCDMDYYMASPAIQRKIDDLKDKIQRLQWNKEILEGKLKEKQQENDSLNFRIQHELEPRIQAEKRSYDAWASYDPSPEGIEHWQSLLDEMISMVEDNPAWFDWEEGTGEMDEKILYVIKHPDTCKVISDEDYDILKRS